MEVQHFESKWTVAAWLDSQDLSRPIADVLLRHAGGDPNDPKHEYNFIMNLAKRGAEGRAELSALIKQDELLDALADVLWTGVQTLSTAAAASAKDLHERFLMNGAGLLEYSSLQDFYGGMERKVGAPKPQVRSAMQAEHTGCDDSRIDFTTDNYGICTTSEVEWLFVAEPNAIPSAGWPQEGKLLEAKAKMEASNAPLLTRQPTILRAGAVPRSTRPLAELDEVRVPSHLFFRVDPLTKVRSLACKQVMGGQNERLGRLKEPLMTLDEAIGARLYVRDEITNSVPSSAHMKHDTRASPLVAPDRPNVCKIQCRPSRTRWEAGSSQE